MNTIGSGSPSMPAPGRLQGAFNGPADQFKASHPSDPVGLNRMESARAMFARELPVGDGEATELAANLSRVDTGALRFAQREGLLFVVVRPGDDIGQAKVLRHLDLDELREQLPDLARLGQAVHEHMATAREALTGDPEHQAPLRKSYRIQLSNLLHDTEKPVTTYRVDPYPILYPGQKPDSLLTRGAVTLEGMAVVHGARTPEEKRTFIELVEALNGDRLKAAQQETLDQIGTNLDAFPAYREKLLADKGAHPEQIPIDSLKHTILLPDLYFHEGKVLDRYDFDAVQMWHGEQGRVVDRHVDPDAMGANGELFPYGGVNRILIRERCLNGDRTAIHEFAHGLDFLLEKKVPDWYRGWKDQLKGALARARQNDTITSYAKANDREYLAEGVAFYYLQREALKKSDPALHGLVEQMLQVANQLGGVNPELEKAHLTHLAGAQSQLQNVLKVARETPDVSRAELTGAAQQLQQLGAAALSKTGLETAQQMLQYGILAGAVDVVLAHVLQARPVDAALEQAATLDPIAQSHKASEVGQQVAFGQQKAGEEFQEAYLAGAALGLKMIQDPKKSTPQERSRKPR